MEASVPPSRSSESRGAVGEGTREFLSMYKSEPGDFMTLFFLMLLTFLSPQVAFEVESVLCLLPVGWGVVSLKHE